MDDFLKNTSHAGDTTLPRKFLIGHFCAIHKRFLEGKRGPGL